MGGVETSVDDVLNLIGFGKFQKITLLLSGIGFAAATVELVSISQVKPYIQAYWDLDVQSLGLMSMYTFIGEIFGGLVWGYFSDKYGREHIFLITSGMMCFLSQFLPLCQSYSQFCWMRLALGFAIGGGLCIDFVYFIECIPAQKRSFRSTFIIFIGIIGLIYSAVTGLCWLKENRFRLFLYICSIPSVVLFIGRVLFRFESPQYLVAKGRIQEAQIVLNKMAKINGIVLNNEFVLVQQVKAERVDSVSSILMEHRLKIALASISFFCQTSAYYGLTLWMSQFLRPWGISASLMLLFVGLAEIPGLFTTSILLSKQRNRCGAKNLLTFNFVLCALLSVLIYFVKGGTMFVLAFCCLYFFIVSSWTILYSFVPESFPTECRSRCFSIAGTFGKIGGMLSPMLFGCLFNAPNISHLMIHFVLASIFLLGAISVLLFK